ncbi:MAG: hypothetical protein EP332_08015 [Bacteroidetes bacterium]|nr:MAG: hypothetical protein EP332_08015 [Bacteroidota bacterium]
MNRTRQLARSIILEICMIFLLLEYYVFHEFQLEPRHLIGNLVLLTLAQIHLWHPFNKSLKWFVHGALILLFIFNFSIQSSMIFGNAFIGKDLPLIWYIAVVLNLSMLWIAITELRKKKLDIQTDETNEAV